jgi:hypothetical protein
MLLISLDMDKQGLLPVVVTLGFFTVTLIVLSFNFTICKMCNGPLNYVITTCDEMVSLKLCIYPLDEWAYKRAIIY